MVALYVTMLFLSFEKTAVASRGIKEASLAGGAGLAWKKGVDTLEGETDTKFVDFGVAGGVGGQEVEVDFGTGSEDEPAVLGSDSDIATEAVEFGTFSTEFLEVETRGDTEIPAVLVVLVEVGELDGDYDSTVSSVFLFAVEGIEGDGIAGTEEVAVVVHGVAIADTDVEIPTFGNGTVIVEGDTEVGAYAIVEAVLGVDATVGEDAGVGVGGEAGLAAPLGVVFLTLGFLGGFLLGGFALVFGLDLLAFLTILLFLQGLLFFALLLFLQFFFSALLFFLQLFLLLLLLFEEFLLFFLLLFHQSFLLFSTLERIVALCKDGAAHEGHGYHKNVKFSHSVSIKFVF